MKHHITELQNISRRTVLSAVALACAGSTHAQTSKPMRIIVPYGPGGTGDVIARLVAQEITQTTGQAVVVDNRPGGAGVIGAAAAAKGDADGSTLLLGYTSELVISPTLIKGVGYVTERDFRPVAFAGATPLLLIAGNNVPGLTLSEFAAAAKAKPNAYSYATAGNGSPAHIAGALFAKVTGTQLLAVPYKGGSQAVTDVLAGNVSIYFSGIPPAVPLVKSGKVKAFGVASTKPSPALPAVPALATSYPDLDLAGWFGFLAPTGTPQSTVDALNAKLNAILQSPVVKTRLVEYGVVTQSMSASDFGNFIKVEQAKYSSLIKSLNIQRE